MAENGTGGEGPCVASDVPDAPRYCYGETGSITAIDTGADDEATRVVEGLPSPAQGP